MSGAAAWRSAAKDAGRVFERLDWQRLGELYFHWGGADFWTEKRPQVLELGAALGEQLAKRVDRGGSSLWVGAGVAELPVLLGEVGALGRTVIATNLRAEECDVLNEGLAAALPACPLRYVAADARVAGVAPFDHLGCISVFTDPETWPVLSDVAYGRMAPVQLPVEQFVAEREQARALAKALLARLRRPGLVTTTAEEVAWLLEAAAEVGDTIDADEELVATAVVGDPVGWLRVTAPA